MDNNELKKIRNRVILIFVAIDLVLIAIFFISYIISNSIYKAALNTLLASIFLAMITILFYFLNNVLFRDRGNRE